MFGRATIRLGIGPHSSLCCYLLTTKVHNDATEVDFAGINTFRHKSKIYLFQN